MRVIEQDILESPYFICYQCDCFSICAYGLAAEIEERFPEANFYGKGTRILGTAEIRGGRIIALYSQRASGDSPRARGDDSPECRLGWFRAALEHAARLAYAAKPPTHAGERLTLALPYGLSGGAWQNYEDTIATFEKSNPHISVLLYDHFRLE